MSKPYTRGQRPPLVESLGSFLDVEFLKVEKAFDTVETEIAAGGGGGGGTTTNLLTFNNGGAGAASGATFDGSAAVTISYNTVGAAPTVHTHTQSDVTGLVAALAAKQPLDATLTALAALSWTAGTQVLTLTGADTFSLKTVGASAGNILDKASGDSLYQPIGSYLTANQTITLSGDASGSGSTAIAVTIANNAVTYAKMQDVSATSRILGRKSAGAGDPEECTASQVLDFIGSTQGQLLYRGASGWGVLSPGTSGQFLKTQGAGADPAWASVQGSGGLTLIETATPTGVGTYTFSNIPADYKDLVLVFSGRDGAAVQNDDAFIRVNGLSTAIYDRQRTYSNGTTTSSDSSNGQTSLLAAGFAGSSADSGVVGAGVIEILNYADTNLHKVLTSHYRIAQATSGSGYVVVVGGAIRTTSAITSVTIFTGSGNWVAGTRLSLYGRGGGTSNPPSKTIVQLQSNSSKATNTFSAQSWGSSDIISDPRGAWASGSPTRFTVPSGYTKARITINATWASNNTGARWAYAQVNGAGLLVEDVRTAQNEGACGADSGWITGLTGGTSYIEIVFAHTSGGNLNLTGGAGLATATRVTIEWDA